MDVADDRADVVRRHHAPAAIVAATEDHDHAQPRQLVVGQADRRLSQLREARRRANRRGSSRPARSRSPRPGSRPSRVRPRCTPACDRTARRPAGRVVSGRTGGPAIGRRARSRPAELGRLGQPVERLVDAGAAPRPGRPAGGSRGRRPGASILPIPRPSPATISGTRPPSSSQTVAASSASSVPARISSTIERRSGGTGRNAHRPRAGEVSATRNSLGRRPGEGRDGSVRPGPGSVKRGRLGPIPRGRGIQPPDGRALEVGDDLRSVQVQHPDRAGRRGQPVDPGFEGDLGDQLARGGVQDAHRLRPAIGHPDAAVVDGQVDGSAADLERARPPRSWPDRSG